MNRTTAEWEELRSGTIPGPWAAIADHPYISIVIANDVDQIHAPIVDITDGSTDEPEVNPHHELLAAAPEAVAEVIRLRKELEVLKGIPTANGHITVRGDDFTNTINRILNGGPQ